MTPAQHEKNGPNREHRCGPGQIPSEGQVRSSHNSRMLERGKLCIPWLVRVLRFYSSRALTSPSWIRSFFLLGVSLGRILRDPFLIGIPLDFTKRREQVISLYTWYVGGKQPFIRIVSLYCPFSLNAVSFMKVSAFERLVKYFFTSSLPINAMEADGWKRDHQPMSSPQSVSLTLTVSISYFLPHQLCSI